MADPLAYHITWTTYGTWLHGDERGWVESGRFEVLPPDPRREEVARGRMAASPTRLDVARRCLVEQTIRDHCAIRRWALHTLNARSNHVHVVVSADVSPEAVMNQLKAWCSRRLTAHAAATEAGPARGRRRWWTEHGSTKWINDEA